jgi:molecular chaperone DnaK
MAADNKLIGNFQLVGIPPAPRGVPQIEVTFDIDANGILHVSAKDLGTGKEQSIRITASSGLNEQEIQRMVKEADAHAGEDKKRRERVETKNRAEAAVYEAEKLLKEHAAKIAEAQQQTLKAAVERVKDAVKRDDVEEMKAASEALTQSWHAVSAEMYSQARQTKQTGPEEGPREAPRQEPGRKKGDDVIDADYEVVDDDKKQE